MTHSPTKLSQLLQVRNKAFIYISCEYNAMLSPRRSCYKKKEPVFHNQLRAHYKVHLSLLSIQHGGHIPVMSCHWVDRTVWLFFENTQRHKVLLISGKDTAHTSTWLQPRGRISAIFVYSFNRPYFVPLFKEVKTSVVPTYLQKKTVERRRACIEYGIT